MRVRTTWYEPIVRKLRRFWPADSVDVPPSLLCQVELGLHLLHQLNENEPAASVWTLFSGYPFARSAGYISTSDKEWMVVCARHRLIGLRRRHVWRQALESYRSLPAEIRAFDVPEENGPARSIRPTVAEDRLDRYDHALRELPDLVRDQVRLAESGPHYFFDRGSRVRVDITPELVGLPLTAVEHVVDRPTRLNGAPVEIPRSELKRTAKWMEGREKEIKKDLPDFQTRSWRADLENVNFDNWMPDRSEFCEEDHLLLDGMLHMVGMVGAGKSTLMTLIAVWAARQKPNYRITLVVGDVAEQLKLTSYLRALLGNKAAGPVIGHSTRGRHVQSLHRRLAAQGRTSILNHCGDEGFDSLNTACPIDAARRQPSVAPLRLLDAPCLGLYPVDENEEEGEEGPPSGDSRVCGCPLWHGCPRNNAARSLPDANIWIANMASLVTSPVSPHISENRLRYLELACLRSDIVIVDEADRVMMNLDEMFAPSATLVTKGSDSSWLDLLHMHNIRELASEGRLQLSDHNVADWEASLSVVALATNRLFPMLNDDQHMRKWVGVEFFNSWTLQKKLLDDWFPETDEPENEEQAEQWEADHVSADEQAFDADGGRPVPTVPEENTRRKSIEVAFDQFRDDPTGDAGPYDSLADQMASVVQHLLITQDPRGAQQRVAGLMRVLRGEVAARADPETLAVHKLQFTLLLAALHQRLDRLTHLWPQVEAALRLDSTNNELVRRPPLDYLPIVPEAPMGNVLGFQYLPDDGRERKDQAKVTGTLRFFRCAGVGRELLLTLQNLGVDRAHARSGPHVVLMSGTSWAGTSMRAHLPVPVRTILRPSKQSLDAVLKTTFSTMFLYDEENRPISLSGQDPKIRPAVLRKMIDRLGRPQADGESLLGREIESVKHTRRRALLLVGSYREAEIAARHLDSIQEWSGHVRVLTADNADFDEASGSLDKTGGPLGSIRRGDVASFANDPTASVLVAPLLALERGHNILNWEREAAFGTVLFLARPHPVPSDVSLSVFAINDWAARFVRGIAGVPRDEKDPTSFDELVARAASLDEAGQMFRGLSRKYWGRLLVRPYFYATLPPDERCSFAWDQLVTMWQVIGRLVRGGVPARVVFVDARFAPNLAIAGTRGAENLSRPPRDTAKTSLLINMREILAPYFSPAADPRTFTDPADPEIVRKLYQPIYDALCRLLDHATSSTATSSIVLRRP